MFKNYKIGAVCFIFFIISAVGQTAYAECLATPNDVPNNSDDKASAGQIKDCLKTFEKAWKESDIEFIRGFFAHDEDMLIFFERRQLTGRSNVETFYEGAFSRAREGSVKFAHSNIDVKARGDMAYLAANFRLELINPEGKETVDEGRISVVFERRDDSWQVVHRHTSFQAAPGPQLHTPLQTGLGRL